MVYIKGFVKQVGVDGPGGSIMWNENHLQTNMLFYAMKPESPLDTKKCCDKNMKTNNHGAARRDLIVSESPPA